jgi:hypothetical protein
MAAAVVKRGSATTQGIHPSQPAPPTSEKTGRRDGWRARFTFYAAQVDAWLLVRGRVFREALRPRRAS